MSTAPATGRSAALVGAAVGLFERNDDGLSVGPVGESVGLRDGPVGARVGPEGASVGPVGIIEGAEDGAVDGLHDGPVGARVGPVGARELPIKGAGTLAGIGDGTEVNTVTVPPVTDTEAEQERVL